MTKKAALGKGIGSLIRETPNQILAQSLQNKDEEASPLSLEEGGSLLINVADIVANPKQPRKIFKKKELEELAESIRENGIIQPLVVTQTQTGFELIAGERRLRAAQEIGLEKVPVVLKRITERDKMIVSIIENVQRADLNCIEEALAYYQLMEEFNLTQEEVAKRLGKERSTIANFLRILKLPRDVIDLVQKDLLSFGHAKILSGVKDRDQVILLAHEAVKEECSVRELEKKIQKKPSILRRPKKENSYDSLRQRLEQNTGFHFSIVSNKRGAGKIGIKFSNSEEFNRIYDFLLRQ